MFSNPEVTRYLLWGPRSREQAVESLNKRLQHRDFEPEGAGLILVIEEKSTGHFLGEVLMKNRSEEHRLGELGYSLLPRAQGRGVAREASIRLVDYAFRDLNLHRVEVRMDGRNLASQRLAESLGFRKEAHFIKNEFIQDEWTDELVYALLAEEWLRLSGSASSNE